MAVQCSNLLAVQAVLESTYGTDPGSGYTNILVNVGSTISPSSQEVARAVMRSHYSPVTITQGAKVFDMTIPVECKGGGVSGGTLVVPEMDLLLRACGMVRTAGQYINYTGLVGTFSIGETVTNSGGAAGAVGRVYENKTGVLYLYGSSDLVVSGGSGLIGNTSGATADSLSGGSMITYTPVSTCAATASITIRFNYSGVRFVAKGVRGNVALSMTSNGYPVMNFTFQGIYATPTDQTIPAADFSDIAPPRVAGAAVRVGTTDVTKFAIENWDFDMGNVINAPNDIKATDNVYAIRINGRNPRGTFTPDMTTLAEHNPFTSWENGTTQNLSVQLGSASGNKLRATWPRAQNVSIGITDRNGVLAYNLGYLATGSDSPGDDEFFLSVLK